MRSRGQGARGQFQVGGWETRGAAVKPPPIRRCSVERNNPHEYVIPASVAHRLFGVCRHDFPRPYIAECRAVCPCPYGPPGRTRSGAGDPDAGPGTLPCWAAGDCSSPIRREARSGRSLPSCAVCAVRPACPLARRRPSNGSVASAASIGPSLIGGRSNGSDVERAGGHRAIVSLNHVVHVHCLNGKTPVRVLPRMIGRRYIVDLTAKLSDQLKCRGTDLS